MKIAFSTTSPSRFFSISSRFKSPNTSYAFYDLVCRTPTHPREPLEAMMMSKSDLQRLKKQSGATYEGSYHLDKSISDEEKIAKIFGGRIKGENRQSSSRITRGEPRVIAGITVPDKPPQPDNCCMSGCINCVWEIFEEDLKHWNKKRKQAAKALVEKGGRWPERFLAPVKWLPKENLPLSLAEGSKPLADESSDPWGDIPVSIRVFAQFEKRLKDRREARIKRSGAEALT